MEHQHATRIFVYGTLLRGERNHRLLATARFEKSARTSAGYALADLGPFPGLIRADAGHVVGEVYAVDAETLAALDRLEDVPRLYVRERVLLEDGEEVDAYRYVQDVSGAPRIAAGRWGERG